MKFVGETTQKLAVLSELALFQPSLKDSRHVLSADADAPLTLGEHATPTVVQRGTDAAHRRAHVVGGAKGQDILTTDLAPKRDLPPESPPQFLNVHTEQL